MWLYFHWEALTLYDLPFPRVKTAILAQFGLNFDKIFSSKVEEASSFIVWVMASSFPLLQVSPKIHKRLIRCGQRSTYTGGMGA